MRKFYLAALLSLFISIDCVAQTTPVADSLSVDSISISNQIAGMLDSFLTVKSYSYLQIGVGIGNQLYSLNNPFLNAQQNKPPLVLTPTIAYFHKSGFNISANEYLLNEDHSFGANQYSITPGYESQPGKDLELLISYTHYFVNNEYSLYSSPIQNDLYSSVVYKKSWLQPGIALGYSTGQSKEVVHLDTTINNIQRHLYDSVTNHLETFTIPFSVQHSFGWQHVFSEKDSISFVPILMLNLGTSTTTVMNNDNIGALASLTKAQMKATRTKLLQKIRKLTRLQTLPFEAESFGIDLEASYTIGNVAIEPDVYLDYYLPTTNQNRFTQVFTVNFNYSF